MAANQDVFSRSIAFGGSFAVDGVRLTFNATNADGQLANFECGLLVQQMNYSYNQSISRLYEIGCPNVYYVAGRTQGAASMARVVGPKPLQLGFYSRFGDVCNAEQNILQFSGKMSCTDGRGATPALQGVDQRDVVRMRHAVIQQLAGSINAQDMIINEQNNFIFLMLEYVQRNTGALSGLA